VSLKARFLAAQEAALCAIRKWWRPITCIWIAGTMAVHGVILPLLMFFRKGEMPTDLTGLSLLVTAIAGAFAVREWGKIKGSVGGDV
jgi:hypothetical protein